MCDILFHIQKISRFERLCYDKDYCYSETKAMKHYQLISFSFALCIIAGMTLDAWAHVHGATDNTFFTPWHAILYSGLFGSVAWYGYLTQRQIAPQAAHRLGLGMGPLVALFGMADLLWHSWFGFEANIQAQLSPPHIALAVILALLVSIPSRQHNQQGYLTWLGAIAGSMAAVVILTLLMFVSPITAVYAELYSGDTVVGLGVSGFLIFVSTWLIVFQWMRRHNAPFGAFTVASGVLGVSQAISKGEWRFVALLIFVGLIAELVGRKTGPTSRVATMLWPGSFALGYFLLLKYTSTLAWGPSVWGGVVVMAVAIGFGIATFAEPTTQLTREERI